MDHLKKIFGVLKSLNNRGFWIAFIAGLFYFSYIFVWLWEVYPLDSFGLENKFASLILLATVFATSVCLSSFFWGLFGNFIFYRPVNLKSYFSPFILAGAFTLVEYVRVWSWGIIWAGNGGLIGPHWTIGNVAYLFSDVPLILKTASVWGIYGIDFTVAAVISFVYLLIFKHINKRRALTHAIIIISFLTVCYGYLVNPRSYKDDISVAIIQTNFPTKISYSSEERLGDFYKKLELLEESADKIGTGIVVFPEGANFLRTLSLFLEPKALINYFLNLSKENILIVDNIKTEEDKKNISKSILISSLNGAAGSHDKTVLTPGGEYLPFIVKLPLDIVRLFLKFEYPLYLSAGSGSNIMSYGNIYLKTVVCSELVSPSVVRNGFSNAIVSVHNFGLFNGGKFLEKQILAMSKFRAVENGSYSVTASNYGRSYIINPDGQIQKSAVTRDYELIIGKIKLAEKPTPYAQVGDWPFLVLSLVLTAQTLRKKSGLN